MLKLPVALSCRGGPRLLRDPETPQALQGPASPEGRFAIVTNVGRGMRWTLWRGETNAHEADGEVVWSSHPDADVKLAEVFPLAMVARKPGSPRRARRKPLKPFAQGVPDRFGGPVVDLLVCFFCFARGCGCDRAAGIPCALFIEGLWLAQLGPQSAPREYKVMSSRA
jgi:hypothetical protein